MGAASSSQEALQTPTTRDLEHTFLPLPSTTTAQCGLCMVWRLMLPLVVQTCVSVGWGVYKTSSLDPPHLPPHPCTTNHTAAHPLQDIQLMDELMDEWEPPAAAPQPAAPPAPAASSQPAEQQHSGGAAMPSPASGAQDAPRIAPKRNVRGEWQGASSTFYVLLWQFCADPVALTVAVTSLAACDHFQQQLGDEFWVPKCGISQDMCFWFLCLCCRLVR